MRTNKLWQLLLGLAIVFSQFALPALNVKADGSYQEVSCLGTGHNPCNVLSEGQRLSVEADLHTWGLYLRYGNGPLHEYWETWVRNPNPAGWTVYGNHQAVPDEIHLPLHGFTSIPLMGFFWWDGTMKFAEPGWLFDGEVPTPLPNPTPLKEWREVKSDSISVPNWDQPEFYQSYSWNGTNRILTWTWVPEIVEDEVVLHVMDLSVGFLNPAQRTPEYTEYLYDLPADVDFVSGEELTVESVNFNSRTVETSYEVTFEDIKWDYEDEVAAYIESGMDEEEAWQNVKAKFADDIENMTGVFYNYENTYFRATWEWVDNYVFVRSDGSKIRISNYDNLMTSRPCTEEEGCFSTGYDLQVGEVVYVDPYTLIDTLMTSDEYREYANLRTTSVYPGRTITEDDLSLLFAREMADELDVVTGVVKGPYDDGYNTVIELEDGTLVYVSASYMPPVGNTVSAYIYKEDDGLNWPVMALFDSEGLLWYFNTDREYGFGFSPEYYGNK